MEKTLKTYVENPQILVENPQILVEIPNALNHPG
jgi:hypothetical protein